LHPMVAAPLADALRRMRDLAQLNRRSGGGPLVADKQLRDLFGSVRGLNEALEQLVGLGKALAAGGQQLRSALHDVRFYER
jgi:hypothetical protein